MLELHHGETDEKIIVTLNELVTLADPYFLFVFDHVETKQTVFLLRSNEDDESDYPYRYNQFNIRTDILFANKPTGEWHYKIYEQADNFSLDPTGKTLLESGKLRLYPATDFEFTTYEQAVTFKTYNG